MKIEKNQITIAIDPHKNHCAIVRFNGVKFDFCNTVDTEKDLLIHQNTAGVERSILLLEYAWVGENKSQSIDRAVLIGRIYQAYHWEGWQRMILSMGNGYKVPSRKDTARMAVIRALADQPKQKWDEHTASAYCMGLWYFSLLKVGHIF